uniref:Helicase ATP-binding domain-containing protein n=1 Tax=viral metagenome TaxID=1070528 RepID=A0A6C0B863_9ZZZZ
MYSKKYRNHNHKNKTYRHVGGINDLPTLNESEETKERQRAVDLIKEILIGIRDGNDAVRVTEPKETGRTKTTGKVSEMYQVFINNKKIDRRALSYIFAEITGIEKFRTNHTNTSGTYRGNKIAGRKMRHNSELMTGIEYADKGKTNRLLGIKDFINLYYHEYYARYFPSTEEPKSKSVSNSILKQEPVAPIKEGALDVEPVIVKETVPFFESIIRAFSPNEPVENAPPEPFEENCIEGQQKNKETGTCEPVYKKIKPKFKAEEPIKEEPTIELTVAKPISEPIFTPATNEISSPSEPPSEAEPVVEETSLYQTETRNPLLEKERKEFEANKENVEYDFLYPHLNDPNFNIKIAKRKEFNDTKYDGTIYDVKKQAEIMCNAEFELMPHQLFVKNFLSFQTPYNSLLLYHSLGTGKTCSAIGVAEEMRAYLKQVGVTQKIMIVASPNVQVNFRTQLFNDKKLKEINGLWNLDTCVGNLLLREINPTSLKGLTRERVVSEINGLIHQYYVFMGYGELANYISKVTNISQDNGFTQKEKKAIEIKKIKKNFNNRLIIIDEVHNIRITDENKEKRTAELLMTVARHSDNMRLLLLSATPMYNSYKEIVWLLNLINLNDKRATVSVNDIFDKEGNFKEEKKLDDGRIIEGGRDILVRKLTGYVSYVRGENPYTFPIRAYPDMFAPESLISEITYPRVQMNNKPIEIPIQSTPVYISQIGQYQGYGYEFIMNYLMTKSFNKTNAYGLEINMPSFENMESFGYTLLLVPLEALNIVYPNTRLDAIILQKEAEQGSEANALKINQPEISSEEGKLIIDDMIGKRGLSQIVNYKTSEGPPLRYDFEYKPNVLESYGPIFSSDKISNYSSKISKICNCIMNSNGIILVYSQYIDGGAVPLALALEELGFSRFGTAQHTRNLFKTPPTEPVDALSLLPRSEYTESFKPAKYVMITGDKYFSPNNGEDMKYITSPENSDGSLVKVILISKAASEGLDFKCIRQIHILEPWYNMNRIEQIVGRGVRNLSHCSLPFEERNVEIYLHGTQPKNDIEPADLYVYRLAEKKTKQIGQVTRLLKETAVDCLLNIGQTNFTVEKFLAIAENANTKINLASKKTVDYQIGDKPFTNVCDYMDNCSFTCSPNQEINSDTDIIKDTYGEEFVKTNYEMIIKRIREMFREQSVYKWSQIENFINAVKVYPKEQIYYTITQFIEDKSEYLLDKYGRRGYLINKGEYYAFQPIEINDEAASTFERTAPVDFKHESVVIKIPEPVKRARKVETDLLTHEEEQEEDEEEESEKPMSYEEILAELKTNLEYSLNPQGELDKGEVDWYKHVNKVIPILINIHKIEIPKITRFVYYHYLDSLKFVDKLTLVINLYAPDFKSKNENEVLIKEYFDEKLVENKSTRGIILADENVCKIYVQSIEDGKIWNEAKQSDKKKLGQFIIDKYIVKASGFKDKVIGFMQMFSRSKNIVFKVKDTSVERNTGSRLENETKGDIIKTLNKILKSKAYDTKNSEKMMKIGLCVIAEMILRDSPEDLFFDTEKAILNNIAF